MSLTGKRAVVLAGWAVSRLVIDCSRFPGVPCVYIYTYILIYIYILNYIILYLMYYILYVIY